MDNWLLPVLLIPTCGVIVNAISPRLQGALRDLHHVSHDQCAICAAHERGFLHRVRLLCGATLLLFLASTVFAFGGLIGAVAEIGHLLPSGIHLALTFVGVVLLLAGCLALALESFLLMTGVWKSGTTQL
jgi:hypothetical protein